MKEEKLELIATRVPPGDRWQLTDGSSTIYENLTEALNAWFVKHKQKVELRLAPLDSKLYAIKTVEVTPEIKTFDLYGEF